MNTRPLLLLPLAIALPVSVRAAVVTDPAPPPAVPDTGPGAPLASIALSPDATLLYSLDQSGELLARDVATGKTRFRGSLDSGATKLRVLRGGSLLVGSQNGAVRLFAKPVEGKPLEAKHSYFGEKSVPGTRPNSLPSIALDDFVLSPDGTRFAVQTIETGRDKYGELSYKLRTARIRVWKLADDKTALEVATFPAAVKGAPKLAWSDDKTLAVALPDVSIQRFDATSGIAQSEWKPPADAAVKVDPLKEEAAFQKRLEKMPPELQERARRAHDRAKERAATTPEGTNAAPDFGVVQGISNDGRLVLSATRNGLQLWNTGDNSSRVLEKSERIEGGEETLFSADGTLVAVRANSRFWLWKTDGTQVGQADIVPRGFSDLAFSPDNTKLWLADNAGAARAWPTSAPLPQVALTMPGFFASWKALTPVENGLFAATSGRVARIDAAGTLRWFDNAPIDGQQSLARPLQPQGLFIKALAASPDGRLWAESVGYDSYSSEMREKEVPSSEVRGRDGRTGAVLWRLPNESRGHPVTLLRFLSDGTLLVGGEGGGVRRRGVSANPFAGLGARDGQTGAAKDLGIEWGRTNGLSEPGSVEILEPSANGKRLVVSSGSGGSGVQTIDLQEKKVLSFFGANQDLPRGAWATSPDGHFLAGPSDAGVGVWDLSKTRTFPNAFAPDFELSLAPAALPHPNALAWSQTNTLAAAFPDGRVLAWTPGFQTGQTPKWETAPGRAIASLAWSSDGQTLSSGDARGDLKTRSGATGALQSTLRLLPPAKEDAPLRWIRWTIDGKITKSAP